MKALAAIGLIAGVMAFTAAAPAQDLVMAPSHVLPAASIHLNLGTDHNGNTTVDLKAQHMAQPSSLNPPQDVYVVWVQRPNQRPQRKGQLKIDNDLNGELKFITSERRFEVFITAESDPNVAEPSGTEVARSAVARKQ